MWDLAFFYKPSKTKNLCAHTSEYVCTTADSVECQPLLKLRHHQRNSVSTINWLRVRAGSSSSIVGGMNAVIIKRQSFGSCIEAGLSGVPDESWRRWWISPSLRFGACVGGTGATCATRPCTTADASLAVGAIRWRDRDMLWMSISLFYSVSRG